MPSFDDSTLWRISAYERFRAETGHSGYAALKGRSVLPTTLAGELSALARRRRSSDVLQVVAACMRKRESALVLLRHAGLVWPLTLFPQHNLYHLPRPIVESLHGGNRDLEVIAVEPPGLRPPGHLFVERIGEASSYRHLPPLLWALALHGPQAQLLDEIAGRAAYRVSAEFVSDGIAHAGALGPVLQRLRVEVSPLARIAVWPGMDRERAVRLLNACYLQGGLIVLRGHHAARDEHPRRLLPWRRPGS